MLENLKNIFKSSETTIFIYVSVIILVYYLGWIYFQLIMKKRTWSTIKENAFSLFYLLIVILAMFYWTLT